MIDGIDWSIVIWLLLGALTGVGEALTGTLLLIPFVIAAIVAAIAVALGADTMWTLIVFGAVSLFVLSLVLRFGRRLDAQPAATHEGARRFIDARGVVTSRVPEEEAGRVRVGGEVWRALSHSGEPIETNARVRVLAIRGNALVVEPVQLDDGSGSI